MMTVSNACPSHGPTFPNVVGSLSNMLHLRYAEQQLE